MRALVSHLLQFLTETPAVAFENAGFLPYSPSPWSPLPADPVPDVCHTDHNKTHCCPNSHLANTAERVHCRSPFAPLIPFCNIHSSPNWNQVPAMALEWTLVSLHPLRRTKSLWLSLPESSSLALVLAVSPIPRQHGAIYFTHLCHSIYDIQCESHQSSWANP